MAETTFARQGRISNGPERQPHEALLPELPVAQLSRVLSMTMNLIVLNLAKRAPGLVPGLLHATETPWALKEFATNNLGVRLLRYCPKLERLILTLRIEMLSLDQRDRIWTVMRRYLIRMNKLNMLCIDNFRLGRVLPKPSSPTATKPVKPAHNRLTNEDWLLLAAPNGPFWARQGREGAWHKESEAWATHSSNCDLHPLAPRVQGLMDNYNKMHGNTTKNKKKK